MTNSRPMVTGFGLIIGRKGIPDAPLWIGVCEEGVNCDTNVPPQQWLAMGSLDPSLLPEEETWYWVTGTWEDDPIESPAGHFLHAIAVTDANFIEQSQYWAWGCCDGHWRWPQHDGLIESLGEIIIFPGDGQEVCTGTLGFQNYTEGGGCLNPTGKDYDGICGDQTHDQIPSHLYMCAWPDNVAGEWFDLGWYEPCGGIPGKCVDPLGEEGSTICGNSTYGQDPTHRYKCKCINGEDCYWDDLGPDPGCGEGKCIDPPGTQGDKICGDENYGQNPNNLYECLNGQWVNRGYSSDCYVGECEGLTASECLVTPGCHWYKKYFWEDYKCHSTEQNMLMDYLPFILAGVGGVAVIAILMRRRAPAPAYYPPPYYYPSPKEKV